MARVVQRRSNPPYAIVFLLFVLAIAVVLAVLFYTYYSDSQRQLADLQQQNALLARPGDLSVPLVAKLRSDAGKPGGQSVIASLRQQSVSLAADISGQATTPQAAADQAEEVLKAPDAASTLVGEISRLRAANKSLTQELAKAKSDQEQLASQLQQASSSAAQQNKGWQAAAQAIRTQIDDKVKQLTQQLTSYNDSLSAIKKSYEQQLAARDTRLTDQTTQITKLQKQITAKDDRIAALEAIVNRYRPKLPNLAERPAGKILRIQQTLGLVYLNIGSSDRVRIGLPFAVYSVGTGVQEGKEIGRIIVTNVYSDTAEARIVESKSANPIQEGDLVANVAFDPNRTYTFVVAGLFDINGNGQFDPNSTQRIKDMITQYGGKVADKVTANTDFVVLGDPPVLPSLPGSPTPAQQQAQQQVAKEIAQYNQDEQTANELRIPILNNNRFLAMVGYSGSTD